MTELREALERVMGLIAKATPEEWRAEAPIESPNEAHIRFRAGYVEFGGSRFGREANAEAVAAAMNLLRTHGPALLAAEADARRYLWLRHDPPSSCCVRIDREGCKAIYTDGEQLDAAIDAHLSGGGE